MKLLLSSLLLGSLWAISSRSAPFTEAVTQTPDVSVTEGEDLNITCCFTEASERVKFIWKKNQTEMSNQSHVLKNQYQESKMNYSCSSLTFLNITREDSGRYICIVNMEIPVIIKSVGNGTVITVVPRVNADGPVEHSTEILTILAMVVVGLLLLIIIGCYCTLRIRHAQAVNVIYEVPHIDSETADMDKHSTSSSRGSSQWCQVPVYESFDYFEGVKSKESG
ncbi:uncharacterized protein [Paralichthys olivaceus]|uniref:uncharacterized protein isoform X1 n=1 Tax=Paralichthys olivaceus TaxID=8255 RepID=UPI0037525CBB